MKLFLGLAVDQEGRVIEIAVQAHDIARAASQVDAEAQKKGVLVLSVGDVDACNRNLANVVEKVG